MNKLKLLIILALGSLASCSDSDVKIKMPYTAISGEYDAEFNLSQPVTASDQVHFRIYNTANSNDSLWIDDENFFESKVKVHWDGNNRFSVIEGVDLYNGEVVNIEGELYKGDSIRVEWRYLQGGDPEDDYVVVAKGKRYTGLN